MAAIVDKVMARDGECYLTIRRGFLSTDPGGDNGCGAAIRDMDQRGLATTLETGQAIAKAVPGSTGGTRRTWLKHTKGHRGSVPVRPGPPRSHAWGSDAHAPGQMAFSIRP